MIKINKKLIIIETIDRENITYFITNTGIETESLFLLLFYILKRYSGYTHFSYNYIDFSYCINGIKINVNNNLSFNKLYEEFLYIQRVLQNKIVNADLKNYTSFYL